MEKPAVLIDERKLRERVCDLGAQITQEHRENVDQPLTLIPILKGSFIFAADLCRHIPLDMTIDFLGLRSYGDSSESSGVVQITQDLKESIEGRQVIVVEDIVDTGLTMTYLLENLKTRNPASVKVVSLLHKPDRAIKAVHIDYLGFTIPDVFVVGYGLDYAQRYRNLPYLGVMDV